MKHSTDHGRLYLNDEEVGEVSVRGWIGNWGIGEFHPSPAFSRYAPLYERWSSLMQSAEKEDRLNPRTADELRQTEFALYGIKTRLRLEKSNQWRDIALLNIDGRKIEWKERA